MIIDIECGMAGGYWSFAMLVKAGSEDSTVGN